ncbi:MAG: hydroxymethylglutaryl-CoA lyase [Planctomycetes bacterium]|nr:hydroxymethylglutaryl-CoA lyase [Planctomycetota bacterium]
MRIRITEVGARDGLQNEAAIISVQDKVAFVDLISAAGVGEIEVSSFVRRDRVPQLGDAEEVFGQISRSGSVVFSALVPNVRGMERALAAKVDKVALLAAASETFSRRNTNATTQEALDACGPLVEMAREARISVRGYLSCVVACPYEGPTDPRRVREVVGRLLEMGVDEIALADTIGVAVPSDIDTLLGVVGDVLEPARTTLHLHDTRGTALACALRAIQLGVVSFDTACGGLGGCPYAPGAAGNLATEDLVYMCNRMGYETGVDLQKFFGASRFIARALGRSLPGRVYKADGR